MTEPANGDLRITMKDLYQAQLQTSERMTDAINAVKQSIDKMTGHLEVIDARNQNADRMHSDFEARLRSLERWRYALPTSIVLALGSLGVGVMELAGGFHH